MGRRVKQVKPHESIPGRRSNSSSKEGRMAHPRLSIHVSTETIYLLFVVGK